MRASLYIVYSSEVPPEKTRLISVVQKIHIKKVLIIPKLV